MYAIIAAGVLLSFIPSVSAGGTPQGTPALDPAKFHALLVGCTKYDNLKPERSLHGPANDVDLMRRFLTDQLHCTAPSVAVLSEAEAAAHGADFRPTRANIERSIQQLIGAAKEGDQVMLLLAGHGGQQPEQKQADPTYLKPDGLDQMFLPCDCGQWSGKKWCVENAIADYELRHWCKQITAKKARLWVILDCCCSGWTLRGNSTEVARSISAEELGIPEAVVTGAQQAAAARQEHTRGNQQTRGAGASDGTGETAPDFGPQSPDYVGLYAAQRDESELEMLMPCGFDENQQSKVQGLLTYAIVDILSRTSRPITYGELANLVRQRYPQWGRTTGPTPIVEGLAQDRVVLGVEHWSGRSSRRWSKDDSGEFSVNAGEVQGLTPGTILALHPAIDQLDPDAVLGYAKVQDCELLQSTIKLTKYEGVKEPRKAALPDGGGFDVVWTDYGSLRVKLGVDLQAMPAEDATGKNAANEQAGKSESDKSTSDMLRHLSGDLKKSFTAESSLYEFVDDARAAQWVVQLRGGKLLLLSRDAAQIRGKLPDDLPRFLIPSDQPAPEIVRDMTRIARAQNLLKLSAVEQSANAAESRGAVADNASKPNVELEILRYKSKTDRSPAVIDLTKEPLVLSPGDYVGWRMTNLGKADVAVSLLYIDAGFGIQAVFPRAGAGADNLLTKNGGTYSTKPAKITANPAGIEHVVLVAVPPQPQRQAPDFSFLEQPTLVQARGAGDNPGLDSPLGRLLQNAMYGQGGTRGLDSTDTAESRLMLQTWKVASGTDQ